MIETAKRKFPQIIKESMNPLDMLALLQHHGLPTRLLDVTANPLVALYFACCDNTSTDGEVVVFKRNIEDVATHPITNAIADSYRFLGIADKPISSFIMDLKKQKYYSEQAFLYEGGDSQQPVMPKYVQKVCSKTIFVETPEYVIRQKVQQGEYILFPNKIVFVEHLKKDCFTNIIEPLQKNNKNLEYRIIINSNSKEEILKHLDVCGINKGTLFPDNMDIVCEQIIQDTKRIAFNY